MRCLAPRPRSFKTCLEFHFDRPSGHGSWLIQLLSKQDYFSTQLGRTPGLPSGSQMNLEKPMGIHLSDKNMRKKRCPGDFRLQNPEFLQLFCCARFQNHVFFFRFEEIYSPGSNPLGHGEAESGQNDRKNMWFWRHATQNDSKNTGFSIRALPRPCILTCFQVAKFILILPRKKAWKYCILT